MIRAVALLMVVTVLAGCGVLRPQPIDVAAGQRVVLGRIDLSAMDVNQGILEVFRQDGAYNRELAIDPGAGEFAVGMPPGRYRIVRFRGLKDGRTPTDYIRYLNVGFDVGDEPAVYIGTLRMHSGFGVTVRATVVDEMEATLRVLRSRYSDVPATATRALMIPG
jgi:hypothetical protein